MNFIVIISMISLITTKSFSFLSKHNYRCLRELSMKKHNKNTLGNVYYPKNKNQVKYVNFLNDDKIKIVLAIGSAGTGKTLFACLKAISLLKSNEVNKIIVTRPAVTVEEEHGFLPGNINKKMEPWIRPILDIFDEFYSKSEIENMFKNGVIEISPLAYMRGRTFKNTIIIGDEMQNSSPNQMMMLTTRLGINSKMIITGDLKQSDKAENNGLKDILEKVKTYKKSDMIKHIEFNDSDIERSEIVKEVINIYNYEKTNDTINVALIPFKTLDENDLKNIVNEKLIVQYLKNFNAKPE